MTDPALVMSLVTTGLGLVDKFYDLAKKWRGGSVGEHSVKVTQANDKLVIDDHGYVQEVTTGELELSAFDQVRHDALMERIEINWKRYNKIDVERAAAAADEKARLEVQMDRLAAELCPDFLKLVQMYENILKRSLPDHYMLLDICTG